MKRNLNVCAVLIIFCLQLHAGQPPAPAQRIIRTRAEVEALISKDGPLPPDWWDKTQLNYPKTLNLNMDKPPQGAPWDQNKNVGQFFWSSINENPSRWKEGVKFAAHLMTLHKDNPDKLREMMRQTAHLYQDCLEDYARAAFWRRKGGDSDGVSIAICYWKLGCKEMAVEILKKIGADDTRHGAVIKLWADMGEYDTAIKLAEQKAKDDIADVGFLLAGDTCRMAGKFSEALKYYQQALAADAAKSGRDIKQTKARAQANIDAVKVFDALDLKRVADGTYKSGSYGYSGTVNVDVVVKNGKIADVKVTQHSEKQYYGAITETPRQIISKQSVKGIDTFASATITSEAIVNATAKALSSGMK
jgi:uncharacterized protein with FMN-binding domain